MKRKKKRFDSLAIVFGKVKLLVFDFDGVMTDNKVWSDEEGREMVACSRADGLGVELLRKKTDLNMLVLSKETNKVVKTRCMKMQIDCAFGVNEKLIFLKEELKKREVNREQVCFVGNDINDLECIQYSGIGIAVQDAYPEVKELADYITEKKGGEGAVREIADKILKERLTHE